MKQIVGIAEMRISRDLDDVLVTYALGSCLGVAIYDPTSHVGGLLHVMLPLSTIDPAKAKKSELGRNNPLPALLPPVPPAFTNPLPTNAHE